MARKALSSFGCILAFGIAPDVLPVSARENNVAVIAAQDLISLQLVRIVEENGASSALPEGSSSLIESLTWQLASGNSAALREQVKGLVSKTAEAVIVKETKEVLVISLPTSELAALRQELLKRGQLSGHADAESDAPTTLLRIQFVQQ
jgi:hypothetical protein